MLPGALCPKPPFAAWASWKVMLHVLQLEKKGSTFFYWYKVLLFSISLFEPSVLSHQLFISNMVPMSASQEGCVLKIMLSCPLLLEEHVWETFFSAQPTLKCWWWIQLFANTVWNCISYNHCHLYNAISIWWLFYLCFPYFKAEEVSSWGCKIEAPTSYWAVLFMGVISFYHPLGVRILSKW